MVGAEQMAALVAAVRAAGAKLVLVGDPEQLQPIAAGAPFRVLAERIGAGPGARLAVRLDDGREVAFDLKDYADIDHGYAATVHRSQGVTVDCAHVLASRQMDRHLAYVALSRHRDRLSLHWSADEMGSEAVLRAALSRQRRNDSTLDYGEADMPVTTPEACFAVRRGLVPDSAIVVPDAQAWPPSPRQPMARRQPKPPAQPQAPPDRKTGTPAPGVTAAVSRHCAAITDSALARRKLAAAWRGSDEDEADLATLVTRAATAARAIAADPASLAALHAQAPGLAGQVEALAHSHLDTLIARARRQMRPSGTEPEPPAAGMGM